MVLRNSCDEEFGSSGNAGSSIRLRQRQKYGNLRMLFSIQRQDSRSAAEISEDLLKIHRKNWRAMWHQLATIGV